MRLPRFLLVLAFVAFAVQLSQAADVALPDLVAKVKASVVRIDTLDAKEAQVGQGSGFFVSANRVVTNLHVIEGAAYADVQTVDGKTYHATGVIATDTEWDLALLSIDIPDGAAAVLPVSQAVPREGETVFVIGSPLGLDATISEGIVSAVRQKPGTGTVIQITAAISPGSSGSPVIDLKGQVIGVATLQATAGQNLNFAVPGARVLALKPGRPRPLMAVTATAGPADQPRKTAGPGLPGAPVKSATAGAGVQSQQLTPEQAAAYAERKCKYACVDGEYLRLPDFDLRYENSRRGAALPERAKYKQVQTTEYRREAVGPGVGDRFNKDGSITRGYVPTDNVPHTVTKQVPLAGYEIEKLSKLWQTELPDLKIGAFGFWPESESLSVLHVIGPDDMIVRGAETSIRMKGWDTTRISEGAALRLVEYNPHVRFTNEFSGSMALVDRRPVAGYGPTSMLLALPTATIRQGLTPEQFADMLSKGIDPAKDDPVRHSPQASGDKSIEPAKATEGM